MTEFTLHQEQVVPGDPEAVFAFFSQAQNLQAITPSWLDFQILSPMPIVMRVGVCIDYRLKVRGVPLRWQSEITAWEPPSRFVDEQRRGPYRRWIHEHRFEKDAGGTRCVDHVRYAVYGGRLVERFLVRPDLERIFDFRRIALERRWGG